MADCDRCFNKKKAVETVLFGLGEHQWVTHLCESHAKLLEREIWVWAQLARGVDELEPDEIMTLPREYLDKVRATTFAVAPAAAPSPAERPVTLYDPELDAGYEPTQSAIDDIAGLDGVDWPTVVEAIENAWAVRPGRQGALIYQTPDLAVIVADDRFVVAVHERDPAELIKPTPVAVRKRVERRGKRGGIGNIGPRTVPEIVAALEDRGWTVTGRGRHLKARGPEGQTLTVAKTASDSRAALNTLADLRRMGVDLKQPHPRPADNSKERPYGEGPETS